MGETIQCSDTANLLCNLKAAVTALECQYQMKLLEDEKLKKKQKETKSHEPTMFMLIPLDEKRKHEAKPHYEGANKRLRKNRDDNCSLDSIASVTSSEYRKLKGHRRDESGEASGSKMRGGVMHSRCGCLHHDGLQDSCPLPECQGQPECLTKPWATCPPAMRYRQQFPEIYPKGPNETFNF